MPGPTHPRNRRTSGVPSARVVAATVGTLNVPSIVVLADFFGADHFAHQEWRRLAACRGQDPETFFPARGASTAEAESFCKRCQVREPCLSYALQYSDNTTM